jgi:GT2 family glycosyltransferase
MRVSIVIPVHGKVALTNACLERLRPIVETRHDVEVIVVDDGSPDATREHVCRQQPWVRLVTHESSQGFAAACNSGAAAAEGEGLLFFNNDLAGDPGWFEALLAYADSNPRADVIGCRLLYPNQLIQHAGIVICGDLLPRHVYRLFPRDHRAVCRSRRFQAVTGACMLVRRSIFEELGGFDEIFSNGFEDVDFCLRLNASGGQVAYCADSVLVHLEAATRGDDDEAFRRNAELFLERWGQTVCADDLSTYVADGMLEVEPGDLYPVRLKVSPELGVVENDELATFKLLGMRSRQVFDLLKENTILRAQSQTGPGSPTPLRSASGQSQPDASPPSQPKPRPQQRDA